MYKFTNIAGATLIALASTSTMAADKKDFNYVVDRFADIEVLRYKVPDFENLSLKQKLLIYHLTEAALAGRDILWDQNGKYNLAIRDLIENVYSNYSGDKDSTEYKALEKYMKQIWFANGIHHHYSMDKFTPDFSREFLEKQISLLPASSRNKVTDTLLEVIFNPAVMPKKVNQAEGQDLILTSATNIYDGVTQQEVEAYYAAIKDTTDMTPVSYGLNTRKIKVDGKVVEQPYKIGGLYTEISTAIFYLKSE